MARGGFDVDTPEQALHRTCAEYLSHAWPKDLPYTHFPAGEARDKKTVTRKGKTYTYSPAAKKLKDMGLKPGWLDFQFILPNAQFATIELKRIGGTLSDEQQDHIDKCRVLGVAVAICHTPEEFEQTCIRWLAAFDRKPRGRMAPSGAMLTGPLLDLMQG